MWKENLIFHDLNEVESLNVDDPNVFEKEISNQQTGLMNMNTQIEAVESDDDSEDSEYETNGFWFKFKAWRGKVN